MLTSWSTSIKFTIGNVIDVVGNWVGCDLFEILLGYYFERSQWLSIQTESVNFV